MPSRGNVTTVDTSEAASKVSSVADVLSESVGVQVRFGVLTMLGCGGDDGGDITAFVLVSRTKGFAIVSDANFANALVTFNPSTGQRLNTILGPLDVFLPQLAINSRNEIYLAVADARTPTPGLRIFDAVTDRELTTTPLNVGQLPPVWTLFIE